MPRLACERAAASGGGDLVAVSAEKQTPYKTVTRATTLQLRRINIIRLSGYRVGLIGDRAAGLSNRLPVARISDGVLRTTLHLLQIFERRRQLLACRGAAKPTFQNLASLDSPPELNV